jgi:hypothetical protein
MKRLFSIRIAVAALMVLGMGTLITAQMKPSPAAPSAKWLFRYDESLPDPTHHSDVRTDPRFRPLLEQNFHQQAFYWNKRDPLWKGAYTFLQVGSGKVKVKENRYVIISGCVPHMCPEEVGFLWVDTDSKNSEVIFAALTAIPGEGKHGVPSLFHLWIFCNHSLPQDFVEKSLPDEFLYSMQDWIGEIGGRHVVSAMFVGPENKMTPLLPSALHSTGTSGQPHEE